MMKTSRGDGGPCYDGRMAAETSAEKKARQRAARKKQPRDMASLAALIVAEATAEPDDEEETDETIEARRRAGVKGGKARAKTIDAERRREIARKAAQARWKKSD